MKRIIYCISLNLLFFSNLLLAQEKTEKKEALIYQININSEINTTSHIYLINGLKEANAMNVDAILLHLNTYGGTLVDADSMRSAILYNPIPVHVFIDNNAASAGALIAIACKKIYMREGASIGAATVVNGGSGEAMPDKYQSYMRSIIRATAESHGKKSVITGNDTIYEWIRDPKIAEAMVDERIYIQNVIDSGKVLTLTAQEAVKMGFCDGIAENVDEVITQHFGYKNYKSAEYKPTFLDKLKGFLMNPAFQAVLIMIIIAGIYFELQTPGVGFPTFAAIGAAILYFTPLYLDGLVQNWEIIVFLIGIAGVFLEIFVFPGFGISGILGIICIGAGLVFALLNNDYFSFKEVRMPDISQALLTVLSGLILSFLIILWISTRIGERGLFRKIALTADLKDSASVNPKEHGLVGKTATAMTVLRPSGKIMIDNEVYDAVSNQGFIEAGKTVKIVKFENMQLYVN
ncbi:MAG: nodulation protein NfeD [Dysgonamonadaceae bacterium]|jgi:membrane-bound serine protease (ClpP class)|nr:nodulation protein NfeD [Dysgonamonadaceae bacterium]